MTDSVDQGMMRNLLALSNYGDLFVGIGEKPIKSVILSEDKETLTFTFEDDSTVIYGVEGDCCSHSWIEHITIPDDIVGEKITAVFDNPLPDNEQPTRNNDDYDVLVVYKTIFRTNKGDIILEYRNNSNGYYGGYLVKKER